MMLPSTTTSALMLGTAVLMCQPAAGATYVCRFAEANGVEYRDGVWKSGTKRGTFEVEFLHSGYHPTALRREPAQAGVEILVLNKGHSTQFVSALGLLADSVLEVTTVNGAGPRRPAVRTVQTAGSQEVTTALTDHGFCSVSPPQPAAPGYRAP
jgi:hypothetical protein